MTYILKRDDVAKDATQTYSVIYPKTVKDIDGKEVVLADRVDKRTIQDIEEEIDALNSRIGALQKMLTDVKAL